MADNLKEKNYEIVSGGTDNHLFLVDLTNKNISGKQAQEVLGKAGIVLNRNMVPFDTKTPNNPSGIRIGTPAVTTRGMKVPEMSRIANWIDLALCKHEDESGLKTIKEEVSELCAAFPVYNTD